MDGSLTLAFVAKVRSVRAPSQAAP